MSQTLIHLQDAKSQHMQSVCGSMRLATGVTLEQFNQQITGEPRAVNCPSCKKTEAYKQSMARFNR